MQLKRYQWAELIGIVLIVLSTAVQVFFIEPAKRKLELSVIGSFVSQAERNLSKELERNFKSLALRDGMSGAKVDELTAGLRYNSKEANRVMRFRSDFARTTSFYEGVYSLLALAVFTIGTLLTAVGRYFAMRDSGSGKVAKV